jgi:hypothetical protein
MVFLLKSFQFNLSSLKYSTWNSQHVIAIVYYTFDPIQDVDGRSWWGIVGKIVILMFERKKNFKWCLNERHESSESKYVQVEFVKILQSK